MLKGAEEGGGGRRVLEATAAGGKYSRRHATASFERLPLPACPSNPQYNGPSFQSHNKIRWNENQPDLFFLKCWSLTRMSKHLVYNHITWSIQGLGLSLKFFTTSNSNICGTWNILTLLRMQLELDWKGVIAISTAITSFFVIVAKEVQIVKFVTLHFQSTTSFILQRAIHDCNPTRLMKV